MFYEINVSLNGVHFFATAERSIKTVDKLKVIHRHLKNAFPKSEGFKLTISKQIESSENIYIGDL